MVLTAMRCNEDFDTSFTPKLGAERNLDRRRSNVGYPGSQEIGMAEWYSNSSGEIQTWTSNLQEVILFNILKAIRGERRQC